MLHVLDQVDGVVGDQVREVVTLIIITMMLQHSVVVESIIVVPAVPDQTHPVAPSCRNVVARIPV